MCGLLPGTAASFQLNAIGYWHHKRLHLCLLGTLPVALWNEHAAAHSLCNVTTAVRPIVQQIRQPFWSQLTEYIGCLALDCRLGRLLL